MAEWHIITCEYPPQVGGVSDYTKLVAEGLAEAGDEVHVWAPRVAGGNEGKGQRAKGEEQRAKSEEKDSASSPITHHSSLVSVHREFGRFRPGDLRRVGKQLDQFPEPRRLLVQWVPHGYGYRSMNLPFCFWLWRRAKLKGDRVELMVHEPFLAFGEGSRKQDAAALIHRLMIMVLLNSASRVWMSIPGWEPRLRSYMLGKSVPLQWIPIPSNVPVVMDSSGISGRRGRYIHNGNLLVGHFGTGEHHIRELLFTATNSLLDQDPNAQLLLMGQGSEQLREELAEKAPNLAARIHATGWLPEDDLSLHVSACDIMLQPYPDGISSRRTSAMVGLSHGTPVLTTHGHLTEPLWGETGAVVLVPTQGMEDLSQLTASLLADSRHRERMGGAARKLYADRFDVRHTIAALRAGLR